MKLTSVRTILLGLIQAGLCLSLYAEAPTVSPQEADLLRQAHAQFSNDPQGAVSTLAAQIEPDSSAALDYKLGEYRLKIGQHAEAAKNFQSANDKQPGFDLALEGLARAQIAAKNWKGAEESIKPLLLNDSLNVDRLSLLGFVYLEQERPRSAEMAYRQAMLAGGESSTLLRQLAHCLLEQSRFVEARGLIRELLVREPASKEFWSLLVNLELKTEDTEKALEHLACMHRLGIADAKQRMILGDLYFNQGMTEAAMAVYESIDNAAGDLAEADILRASRAMLRRGKLDQAKRFLAMSTAEISKIERRELEGRLALNRKEFDVAEKAFKEIIRENPLHTEVMNLLGDTLMGKEEPMQAALWFERSANSSDENAAFYALLKLRKLAIERGELKTALAYCEKAYQLREDAGLLTYIEQLRRQAALSDFDAP